MVPNQLSSLNPLQADIFTYFGSEIVNLGQSPIIGNTGFTPSPASPYFIVDFHNQQEVNIQIIIFLFENFF
jgi:hypothetical protein